MKISENIYFSFLIVVLYQFNALSQICPTPLPKKYQNVQSGSIVAAYFGNWDVYGDHQYHIHNIEPVAHKLTHLIYGFMKPDGATGRCKPHDVWADLGAYDDGQTKIGGNFAKMIALKKKFPHLKILLSIGGGTYNKNFIQIAQDKEKLLYFAQSCVDMMDFYDHAYRIAGQSEFKTNHLEYEGLFDGLDIDWEWSPSQMNFELARSYTVFMYELRRLLDLRKQRTGQSSLLTVALQITPKIYQNLELEKVGKVIDWYNVMAYDFFGSSSGTIGFNAPVCGGPAVYSVDGAVQGIIAQGVSPKKMVLGLPLYGYVYEDSNGYNSTIKSKDKVKAVSYHIIKSKYLGNASFKKGWSSYEKVPSLYSAKDKIFVTYDGKDSLIDKVKFAQQQRMQGVVLWRLSGDDAEHSLVKTVISAI